MNNSIAPPMIDDWDFDQDFEYTPPERRPRRVNKCEFSANLARALRAANARQHTTTGAPAVVYYDAYSSDEPVDDEPGTVGPVDDTPDDAPDEPDYGDDQPGYLLGHVVDRKPLLDHVVETRGGEYSGGEYPGGAYLGRESSGGESPGGGSPHCDCSCWECTGGGPAQMDESGTEHGGSFYRVPLVPERVAPSSSILDDIVHLDGGPADQ